MILNKYFYIFELPRHGRGATLGVDHTNVKAFTPSPVYWLFLFISILNRLYKISGSMGFNTLILFRLIIN
jgi:hypothetical protein